MAVNADANNMASNGVQFGGFGGMDGALGGSILQVGRSNF